MGRGGGRVKILPFSSLSLQLPPTPSFSSVVLSHRVDALNEGIGIFTLLQPLPPLSPHRMRKKVKKVKRKSNNLFDSEFHQCVHEGWMMEEREGEGIWSCMPLPLPPLSPTL